MRRKVDGFFDPAEGEASEGRADRSREEDRGLAEAEDEDGEEEAEGGEWEGSVASERRAKEEAVDVPTLWPLLERLDASRVAAAPPSCFSFSFPSLLSLSLSVEAEWVALARAAALSLSSPRSSPPPGRRSAFRSSPSFFLFSLSLLSLRVAAMSCPSMSMEERVWNSSSSSLTSTPLRLLLHALDRE